MGVPLLLFLTLGLLPGVFPQCSGSTYSYFASPTSCASCASGSLFLSSSLGCSPAASVAGGQDSSFAAGPTDTAFFLSGSQAEGADAFVAPVAAPAFGPSHLGSSTGALSLTASGTYLNLPPSSALAAAMPTGGSALTLSAWYKCAAASQPSGSASTLVEWGVAGNAAANGNFKSSLTLSTSPTYAVSRLAGGFVPSTKSWADGYASSAAFNGAMGMAFDASGNLWVADMLNCVIRTVSPSGFVTTVAGRNPVDGFYNGYNDGSAFAARFFYPYGIAISPSTGVVYITDRGNQCVRSFNGYAVSTVAGRCVGRTNNFVLWYSLPVATTMADGMGVGATFVAPSGIAVIGNALYVVDLCVIRKIDLANFNTVTTFAGGAGGTTCGSILAGVGRAARFGQAPTFFGLSASNHLTTDGVNLFMADKSNNAIVKVTVASGAVENYASGVVPAAPEMVAVAPGGVLYVTTYGSIFKVYPGGGQWAPLAGSAIGAANGDADGTGTAGMFQGLFGIVVNAQGELIVNQAGNINMVRKVILLAQPAAPCDGKWHHLAQTFAGNTNGGAVSVFLDGALLRSTSAYLVLLTSSRVRIGWNGLATGNDGDRFIGSVSDVRSYARQLTPTEILGLAQPPLPAYVNTILTPSVATSGSTAYRWTCAPGNTGTTQSWALDTTSNTWTLTGGPVACSSCVPGQFAVGASCGSCAAGTFSTTNGAAACTVCPAGTTSTPGSSSCTACLPGYFSAAGAPACTACPAGTYGTSPASNTCTPCGANKYSASIGATSSATCLACGQGSSQSGSSFCVCPQGTRNSAGDAAATTCIGCAAGSYSYSSPACALCSASAGSTFVATWLGCKPATGASDTKFYLSGRSDEGVSSFPVTGAMANVSFGADFQNIASGALVLGQNAFLATPSAAANDLAASLPAGGSPAASAAAWVRCASEQQLPGSAATVIEWGVVGSAVAQPKTKFALTVAQTAQEPTVSIFAGGYKDPSGGYNSLLNGPAIKSTFQNSRGMGVDEVAGFLYVAVRYVGVRKVTLGTGVSSMFAGYDATIPKPWGVNTLDRGYVDAVGTNARFEDPAGLVVHPSTGTLYIADLYNQCIRAITRSADVSTLAGQCCGMTTLTTQLFTCATASYNFIGTMATFVNPSGLALDPTGTTLFVMDNCAVRKLFIATRQTLALVGGSCGAAVDSVGVGAIFSYPPNGRAPSNALAADKKGNVFVADHSNGLVRVINVATATVSTYSSAISAPTQLSVNPVDGLLYVSDIATHKIYRVFPGGAAVAVAGSVLGVAGSGNYVMGGTYTMGYVTAGLPASSVTLNIPRAHATLSNGNILFLDDNWAVLQLNFSRPRFLSVTTSGTISLLRTLVAPRVSRAFSWTAPSSRRASPLRSICRQARATPPRCALDGMET